MIWKPSPNWGYPRFNHGRNGEKIVAIVDHITGGGWEPSNNWLLNPDSFVSAHYLIRKDGMVFQYVKEENAAWGCGLDFSLDLSYYRSNVTIPFIKNVWERRVNPNLMVVNIEHESSGEALTEEQYNSSLLLHFSITERYGILINHNYIVGHSDVNLRERPNDPGAAFPWIRLIDDLRRLKVNKEELLVYSQWAKARLDNNEDPRDTSAFIAHLKALGCEYTTPMRYGLPFVSVVGS